MKLMLGRMPEHEYRRHDEEMRYGRAESYWRDDPESRRGRRTRSELDDPDMRRGRRTRSEWDAPDTRRTRSEWDNPDMRRGRRTRGEMELYMPWEHWGGADLEDRRQTRGCDEEHYFPEQERHRIGYAAEHEAPHMAAEHHGGETMHHGMAAVKELAPALEGVLEDSVKVLQSPPQTWPAYLHRKDYAGIVKMETKELLSALEAKKSVADMRKELTHTIAALFKLATS